MLKHSPVSFEGYHVSQHDRKPNRNIIESSRKRSMCALYTLYINKLVMKAFLTGMLKATVEILSLAPFPHPKFDTQSLAETLSAPCNQACLRVDLPHPPKPKMIT